MKPKFMLDTNICIYLMKHQPPQVRARFAECFVGDVVISAITLAELEFGIACSGESQARNQAALDALLEDLLVAPFEARAARAYGPLRAANRERNKDALDKLIASHALSLGVTLVTNNEADFRGFSGLVVENWINNH
ncbi:MAG: type II toxin-antitoxin system VapC family toxin [Oxalobacteraceae bacterium]|jgi:tRNA(fMet)-specific endonuclease VapC|nr:type II toxin-antitoxin system VapC family toxin [Oxalobacteraceae bacterium]